MKIYLHIGTHKTGSTAIQNIFNDNREYFIKQGLYYPPAYKHWSGQHDLAWLMKGVDADLVRKYVADIIARAQELGCRKIFLSSEEFEFVRNVSILMILNELDGVDIEVLCFLRKQDDYLESEYNQHIKMYDVRFEEDIFHFYTFHEFYSRFNYMALLQPWISCFGEDNITIVPYDQLGKGTKIFTTVFEYLSVEGNADLTVNKGENSSLSPLSTVYLARLNRRKDITKVEHQKAIRYLSEECAGKGQRLLSREYRKRIIERFSMSNQIISDKFLAGRDLFQEIAVEQVDVDFYLDYSEEFFQLLIDSIKGNK